MSAPPPPPDRLQGWLWKKGNMRWQRRWFEMSVSARALRYALGPGQAWRGSLEITADGKVQALSDRPFAFQLVIKGRALKVAAEDVVQADLWSRALASATAAAVAAAASNPVVKFGGAEFCVGARYALKRKVGSGAYGFVVSAVDTSCDADVAIKKIANCFEDLVDAKRILREIRLMRCFDHPNVVSLYDVIVPSTGGTGAYDDLYIISPLMSTDLAKIMHSKTHLSEAQVQYLFYQLLRGVQYVHACRVLHRDLKPANLLIDIGTCGLRICDFGLARSINAQADADGRAPELTEYVVTRWYRAPEIMLGYHRYDEAIDVWSVACIFAELLLGAPLFAGHDYIHQLKLISRTLGPPTEAALWFVSNQNAREFMQQLPPGPQAGCALGERLGNNPADADALGLLSSLLVFDPRARVTVAAALGHPFVAAFCGDEGQPGTPHGGPEPILLDDVEAVPLGRQEIRNAIRAEAEEFHETRMEDT